MTIESEIIKPAKHGFVIDLTEGERRVQVRVFEFERTEISPGGMCEMPVTLHAGEAQRRLRQAGEALRESVADKADLVLDAEARGVRVSLPREEDCHMGGPAK